MAYVSILSDFRKNWLFLSILFIGFIPQIWGGYSMYLLILLFPFILKKNIPKQTKSTVLIIAFSICYTIPQIFQRNCPSFSILIFYLTFPIIAYWSGIYVCRTTRNPNTPFVILFLLIVCLASQAIILNVYDYVQTGQIININRTIADTSGGMQKATIHNMMLAMAIGGIGALFIKPNQNFDSQIKPFILIVAFIALFSAIHLLNRTALVLAMVSSVIGMGWEGIKMKRIINIAIFTGVICIIYSVFFNDGILLKLIEVGFSSREEYSSKYSAATAGGRTEKWIGGLQQIFSEPLGYDGLLMNGKITFAHNTWLDIGVRGGVIPFIIIITLTFMFLFVLRKILIFSILSKFEKGYLLMTTICMFMQWAVEPVIEGVFPLFLIFFYLYGFFNGYNNDPNYMRPRHSTS